MLCDNETANMKCGGTFPLNFRSVVGYYYLFCMCGCADTKGFRLEFKLRFTLSS